ARTAARPAEAWPSLRNLNPFDGLLLRCAPPRHLSRKPLACHHWHMLTEARRGGYPMAGSVIEITDETFEREIIKSDKPVLVDFWAAWCQPCRAIAPLVPQLAESYNSKVKSGTVDID